MDRPIYTIDLDDSSFTAFAETFKRFQEQSKAISATWRASDDLIAQAAKNLKSMSLPHVDSSGPKSIADGLGDSIASWGALSKRAKTFSGEVKDATLSLGKWTGLTAVFSGIVAAGGFYGLSRMASGVSSRRTAAAQLGTTYGGLQTARAAFGRIGGVESIVGGLSGALHSTQGMAPLFSLMGGSAERLRGGDPVEAFAAILPRLKALADRAEPGNLRERLKAMGLDRIGVSVETMKMLKSMSREEVDDMLKTYRENKQRQELSSEAQRNLQDFTRALDLAGARMTTLLGENLVRLTPAIGQVAETFASVLEKLLNSEVGKWLESLDKEILKFADWIDSPDFAASIEAFVSKVETAGRLFTAFGVEAKPQTRFQRRTVVDEKGNQHEETVEVTPDLPKGQARRRIMEHIHPGEVSTPKPGHGRMMLKESTRGAGFTPAVPAPRPGESVESVAARIRDVRPDLESEQCVALAKAMVGSSASVRTWRRGENVLSGNLQPGTPIATFMDRSGRPSDRYDAGGTGAPGNHTTHAAVFESYARDKDGRIVGMTVHEQYKGSGGPHRKTYGLGGFGTRNAANYYSINDSSGRPLGRANPQLKGAQNHVEVHDDSGARVSMESMRIGPMPNATKDPRYSFANRR